MTTANFSNLDLSVTLTDTLGIFEVQSYITLWQSSFSYLNIDLMYRAEASKIVFTEKDNI